MLALLAVVQVAGCGGGSDVSKAEYVRNANAACSESNERRERSVRSRRFSLPRRQSGSKR
jgi:hypothetical protein